MQALPHVKIIKTSIKFHPAQSNSYFIVTFATDRYREIAKPGLGCTENKSQIFHPRIIVFFGRRLRLQTRNQKILTTSQTHYQGKGFTRFMLLFYLKN